PGAGWLVWFSYATPRRRSPMGTQVDSPLQRQWTSLLRNGSMARIAAHVFGASCSSRRAPNVYVPAVMRSILMAGVRYAADDEGLAVDARPRHHDRQARRGPPHRARARWRSRGERG